MTDTSKPAPTIPPVETLREANRLEDALLDFDIHTGRFKTQSNACFVMQAANAYLVLLKVLGEARLKALMEGDEMLKSCQKFNTSQEHVKSDNIRASGTVLPALPDGWDWVSIRRYEPKEMTAPALAIQRAAYDESAIIWAATVAGKNSGFTVLGLTIRAAVVKALSVISAAQDKE